MVNWPTPATLGFLLLGLAPLAYAAAREFFGRSKDGMSLLFWGVLFFWLGYHLSPWLYFVLRSEWDYFLLVPAHIDEGLMFSTLCMSLYIVGYELLRYRLGRLRAGEVRVVRLEVNQTLLVVFSIVCFVCFLIEVGGVSEALVATRGRGDDQWEARDFQGKIMQMMVVLGMAARLVLACLGSVFMLNAPCSRTRRVLIGGLALVVSSLRMWHGFSRGSGSAFALFGLLALYLKGRRAIPAALLGIVAAMHLGNVGLCAREYHLPGLINFLDALVTFLPGSSEYGELPFTTPASNPLNAIDTLTLMVDLRIVEEPGPGTIWNFLLSLNPFPSELLPFQPVRMDLAEVMGTVGSCGLTTPTFAELYFGFGIWGSLFMIPLGMCYGWFDHLRSRTMGVVTSICFLLCFVSLPLSLHSETRAATRPLLYGACLWCCAQLYRRFTAAAPGWKPSSFQGRTGAWQVMR